MGRSGPRSCSGSSSSIPEKPPAILAAVTKGYSAEAAHFCSGNTLPLHMRGKKPFITINKLSANHSLKKSFLFHNKSFRVLITWCYFSASVFPQECRISKWLISATNKALVFSASLSDRWSNFALGLAWLGFGGFFLGFLFVSFKD